ncbi:MAG: HRDC domain-containing protein [Desulfobacterales bacterium]|nr:HRDC domain-containing protein [Desulfobacterales bacterium]
MAVQYQFFILPVKNLEQTASDLNRFLASKKVINIHREFVSNGENSFWNIAVEYLTEQDNEDTSGKKRVDYREVLKQEDFALFAKLREWRKTAAEKEGVPVYNLFTNEQLAQIAEHKINTKAALIKLEGVGDARVKKYSDAVIKIVEDEIKLLEQKKTNEKSGASLSSNPRL